MSNEVQFDFDEEQRPEYRRQGSKLSRLVVKWSGGRINEAQANYVLLGVAVAVFALSFLLLPDSAGISPPQIPPTLSVL
ncbi:MAG: hypothetical protein WBC83_01655 [Minisyncoccia bacterium]